MTFLRGGACLGLAVALALGGCGRLPRGAAIETEIVGRAQQENAGFAYYEVTRALLPTLGEWPRVNPEVSAGWPRRTPGSNGSLIAPGDIVAVQIWDSSDNSLLAAPQQRAVPIDNLSVSPSGQIFVPYAGEVRISGMSAEHARQVVQDRVSEIAPSAQVVLTVKPGRSNTVDLVAGVASPGSYPLPNRNYSVLSLISQGGGVPPQLRNPRVRLQRGSKTYVTAVDTLYEHPEADAILQGGDKVIVEEDDRYFLSLGAAGKEAVNYFTEDEITALDAISIIGGIADSRADPEGVLVLREYPRSALAAGTRGPRQERVVFSIDLTTADGLFSAKNFMIAPGDVVLATESPVSNLRTVASLIGTGFGLVRAAGNATD